MRKTLQFFACLPLLFSCVDGDKPDFDTQNTYRVSSTDYIGENEIMYVIIHDATGTVLDYSQIHNGETVKFQVDKSKKHHQSVYTIRDNENRHDEFISTKIDQDFSEDLVLKKSNQNSPTQIGTFNVNVNDDNPIGYFVTGNGSASQYSSNANNHIMKLFSGKNNPMVIASQKGMKRYAYLDNPQKDDIYTLEYDEMRGFEKILKLPKSDFSDFNYQIKSLEEHNGVFYPNYVLADFGYYYNQEENYELGYVDNIKTYSTLVPGKKATYPKTRFIYSKIGSSPNEITLLNIDEIKVEKRSISDFRLDTMVENAEYNIVFHSKKTQQFDIKKPTSFSWSVYSNDPNFSISLPDELISRHPMMLPEFSQLYLGSVIITKFLSGSSTSGLNEYESTAVQQSFN